jgi:hypothetical protein
MEPTKPNNKQHARRWRLLRPPWPPKELDQRVAGGPTGARGVVDQAAPAPSRVRFVAEASGYGGPIRRVAKARTPYGDSGWNARRGPGPSAQRTTARPPRRAR